MAKRKREFDPQKDQHWRDVLTRFHSSGLSIREFCRQERLPEPRFYAWRRTIAERDGTWVARRPSPARHKPAVSPKRPSRPRPQRPAFVPLVIHPGALAQSAIGLAIELRGGRMLRLPDSMPPQRLAELIRALEASEAAS
jgi:hypothetical protein